MLVRIPDSKIEKNKSHLENLLTVKKVRVNVLESSIGLVIFCARAIPSARALIRRFYDLIASVKEKKPFDLIRVTIEVKQDVMVWLEFLSYFNGENVTRKVVD